MRIRANFSESNQSFRVSAEDVVVLTAPGGGTGQNGATFYPVISADGTLSWTNDAGLANPSPVNIKGPPGIPGISPTVNIQEIENGHRVTITDVVGDHTFDVLHGSTGSINSDSVLSIIKDNTYTKEKLNELLDAKVPKVEGYSLILDSEITRLAALSNYDDTQLVKDVGELDKNLKILDEYIGEIPSSYGEKTIVSYIDRRIRDIANSSPDIGPSVDGVIDIVPVATADLVGGVRSAKDELISDANGTSYKVKSNAVYVDDTGEMSIKSISTDVLCNGQEELIINGGASKSKA